MADTLISSAGHTSSPVFDTLWTYHPEAFCIFGFWAIDPAINMATIDWTSTERQIPPRQRQVVHTEEGHYQCADTLQAVRFNTDFFCQTAHDVIDVEVSLDGLPRRASCVCEKKGHADDDEALEVVQPFFKSVKEAMELYVPDGAPRVKVEVYRDDDGDFRFRVGGLEPFSVLPKLIPQSLTLPRPNLDFEIF